MQNDGVVLAHVTRNGYVESIHRGHAVLIGADGAVLEAWGEPDGQIFPRSAVKPLQAVAMLGAGLDLHGAQLAVAASSHSGEQFHRQIVSEILAAGGFSPSDLRNTPDLPFGEAARHEYLACGGVASSLAQGCSGKHAAMLRTCAHLGAAPADYRDPEHPVERLIAAGLAEYTGEQLGGIGVDGCGAPTWQMSLTGLARAFSRLVQSPEQSAVRVRTAMQEHPNHVAGPGRDLTAFLSAVPGAIGKDAVEGVHVVALPDGRACAVKVADGSERARASCIAALLTRAGLPAELTARFASPPVLGGGQPVGQVEAQL